MVPSARLLVWTASITVPLALWPVASGKAVLPALTIFMGFVLVVAVDAFLAPRRLQGLSLELPEVLRLTRDRQTSLAMDVVHPIQGARQIRLGIVWPGALQGDPDEMEIKLPEGAERSRVEWKCGSARRGRYIVNRAVAECASRLGFWLARRIMPVKCEVRVYPNLHNERRSLAALFLHRSTQGFHTQRQIGKGREFEKLREYISGDSYDDIHWKATARRGHPITKVFQIERTQQVYVILDASRLSARLVESHQEGETDPESAHEKATVLERFISAALVMGLAAEQQGDLFGLVAFSDRIETFLRAGHGQAHYGACRDTLYTLEPRLVSPDFEELASFIRLRLRRRAMLFFLTALDDPMLAESFVRHADLICHHHLVLVNMVRPPGVAPLFTQNRTDTLDDLYSHLGGHLRWQNLRELEKILQRRGIRFSLLENEKLAVQLVSRYLEVKQRQLL